MHKIKAPELRRRVLRFLTHLVIQRAKPGDKYSLVTK